MCLLVVAQRVADQARCDVHDLDHAVVGHTGRPDHAQCAHDLSVHLVRGAHDRQVFKRNDLAFAADEDAHTLGLARNIQQAHQLRLLLEEVERTTQVAHIGREVADR